MKLYSILLLTFQIMFGASGLEAWNIGDPDQEATITGTWRGKSICTDKNSGCHDEEVVYRMVQVSGTETVNIDADRIVDGKAINMGALVFTYDKTKNMLSYNSGKSSWQLTVKGNQISGVLLRDGAVFRNVTLTRDK